MDRKDEWICCKKTKKKKSLFAYTYIQSSKKGRKVGGEGGKGMTIEFDWKGIRRWMEGRYNVRIESWSCWSKFEKVTSSDQRIIPRKNENDLFEHKRRWEGDRENLTSKFLNGRFFLSERLWWLIWLFYHFIHIVVLGIDRPLVSWIRPILS